MWGSDVTQIHGPKPFCNGLMPITSSPEETLCCRLDSSFDDEPARTEITVLSPMREPARNA